MKKWINLGLIGALTLALCGCAGTNNQTKKVSKTDFYFDTVITITLYGTEDAALIDDCFAMADHYENLFSTTVPDSDIAKINASAGIAPVTVDEETMDVIDKGLTYKEISGGKFDLCCGALTSLWSISEIADEIGEDHMASSDNIPSESEINACLDAMKQSDLLFIDEANNTVYLTSSDVQMDLGAIAKGYIADRMKEYLNSKGMTNGVISLGGNILTLGEKANDATYNIGITRPFSSTGEVYGSVKVRDASVVTSGNYERYFIVDDKIYHHILDLETGYPVENNLYSVTIISDSSCDGDALSTICYILGLKDGMALIEETEGVEAIFITSDYEAHTTSGCNALDFEVNQ